MRGGPFLVGTSRRSNFGFEGSVGGGIPIIHTIRRGLVGNRIRRVTGIINGTCNYILTRMARERKPFAEILADAQAHGFAEANPALDVDGIDAAQKLASEAHLTAFHATHGLRSVTLRYFNVYGPRQDPNSEYAAVVPKFVTRALEGRSLLIFGDGGQTRDFVFVEDVARANLLAFESELGSGKPVSGENAVWNTSRVRLLDYCPDEDLAGLYSGARALVFPSLFEGFGLPVLEALAASIPLACSNIDPVSGIAGEAALKFDPRDIPSMTEALLAVTGDGELRQHLSQAGPKQAACFPWRATAEGTLSALLEAVEA